MQDRRRRPDERSVDCNECQNGSKTVAPKFNKQRGRYCYKFSKPEIRSGLIKIEYGGKKSDARDRDGLLYAMDILADWQKQERGPTDHESIMKGLGMCIWSWPFGEQERDAYRLISFCSGGMAMALPHPELSHDDQPNLFFEFLDVYLKAKSEYGEKNRGSDT